MTYQKVFIYTFCECRHYFVYKKENANVKIVLLSVTSI